MGESEAEILNNFSSKFFNNICRICMKSGELQSLFEFKDYKCNSKCDDLSSKLKFCFGVEASADDKMPSHICEVCSDALIISYDLKKLCKNTESVLREILSTSIKTHKSKSLKENRKKCERKFNMKLAKDNTGDTTIIKLENEYSDDAIEFLSEDFNQIFHDNYKSYDSDDQVMLQIVEEGSQEVVIQHEDLEKVSETDLVGEDKLSTEVQTQVEKRMFKCYGCDMMLPTRWDRQLHEDIDCPELPPGTLYKCRLCPITTPDRDKFDKHIWIDHKKTLPPESERNNLTAAAKIRPRDDRDTTISRKIICEKCGIVLKNMRGYLQHCLKHEGKQWFQCSHCPYRTTVRHTYNLHNKYRHLGYELIRCDQCSFKTNRKENLKIHQRRHTGERPFTCTLCDYKAVNKSNLTKHITTHTNIRPYQCNVCSLCYTTNRALKCHKMRVHEHVKMFYCKPCRTKYVGEEAFNRHLIKKHSSGISHTD